MNFFDKISLVLVKPKEFFAKVHNETFMQPFLFYLIFLLVSNIGTSLYYISQYNISMYWYFPIYLASAVLSTIMLFVSTGLTHLALKMIKGHGSYTDTVISVVYGSIPALLWGIVATAMLVLIKSFWVYIPIMIFGGAIWAYAIYLSVVGISILHKISEGKALLGYFIPFFVMFAVLFIIIFLVVIVAITIGLGG